REYLVALRPADDGLVMQQLHYAHEVRPFAEVEIPKGEVKEQELKLAVMLAEQITSDEFKPESYPDRSNETLRNLIQRKVEGEDIVALRTDRPKSEVIDLMEALKASLEGSKRTSEARKPARRAPAPAHAAAKPQRAAARGRRK
ncbi:MAG TPA: Ku protein, partial [Thermoanaerobaculia bacterium]